MRDDSGLAQTAKDLLAGTVGGVAQVLVGQPFDIVKVRMQTAQAGTYTGMGDCARRILVNESPFAFYKGTLTPLLGIGVCVSIQFAALQSVKRFFTQQNLRSGRGGKTGEELAAGQLFVAGAWAGLANGIVSGPVEHIRIRLQTQPASAPLYKGPWGAITSIYGQHGISGIFKGQVPTFLREGLGYGAYFWCYETLMQREMRKRGCKREEVPALWAVGFGAAAGYALWFTIYPIDVIKSRIQTDGFTPSTRQYSGTLDCARKLWRGEGIAGFTRGLGPTLLRSPFANGATFIAFELAYRALS
ncbi:mitochondrial carrier [Dacryopinax primogenitus]|uniref:Mitochondrial carrier n=1 Tax=Dacryopinax primogenitus (strain DJM 731) TaxID=1858805 RepID=M5G2P6_DACPD|nr:mitochondrial carrier [Dacryopinax primogenitus]EJU04496.1 mitochondrial carrier [Dacryopinax primogenitus]